MPSGALVTLLTLSVSVSLSVLVPLNHRGYVRRENVIPYIMGAGITTFVDTLLAALLLTQSHRLCRRPGADGERGAGVSRRF